MKSIEKYNDKIFEEVKHIDEFGNEYWLARELMSILEYTLWQKFHRIIKTAMENCSNSNYNVLDHFIGVNKMVNIGSDSNCQTSILEIY